jgi:hypothetical protein
MAFSGGQRHRLSRSVEWMVTHPLRAGGLSVPHLCLPAEQACEHRTRPLPLRTTSRRLARVKLRYRFVGRKRACGASQAARLNILMSLVRKLQQGRSVWEAVLEYQGEEKIPRGDTRHADDSVTQAEIT